MQQSPLLSSHCQSSLAARWEGGAHTAAVNFCEEKARTSPAAILSTSFPWQGERTEVCGVMEHPTVAASPPLQDLFMGWELPLQKPNPHCPYGISSRL